MNNNNNNADFQRALAMSMNARPNSPRPNNNNANLQRALAASRGNNNNANLRNALRQSANANRKRRQNERAEMNREYEAALAANALASQRVNTPPMLAQGAKFGNFNQMLPNMKPKVNNSKVAKAMRVATPENTAALAEEFPQFPYAQIEKILQQQKGNVNATRKNLVRRKTVLKLGGSRRNNRK
jgi:hypothetical protein